MTKPYLVYILKCSDGTFYTGITNDLERRLKAHNKGTASKYTSVRRPVSVIYTETADDKSSALKRELQIKALSRKEKEVLILKQNNN